jgi:NADPH-dependent glutamate synthase beta subunit-like oxidoreductase
VELEGAEEEGVEFLFMSGPKRIVGDNGKVSGLEITKMILGDVDTSGRRRPVSTGKTQIVPCDTVIIAAGEKVDSEFLKVYGVKTNKDGTIKANHITLNAGPAKFYAGGDAVTGPATAAEAMGLARKAAETIDFALVGEKRFQRLFVRFVYKNEVPAETPEMGKSKGKTVPVKDRIGNFQEICLGYTGEQARYESERCLRCDVRTTGH